VDGNWTPGKAYGTLLRHTPEEPHTMYSLARLLAGPAIIKIQQ